MGENNLTHNFQNMVHNNIEMTNNKNRNTDSALSIEAELTNNWVWRGQQLAAGPHANAILSFSPADNLSLGVNATVPLSTHNNDGRMTNINFNAMYTLNDNFKLGLSHQTWTDRHAHNIDAPREKPTPFDAEVIELQAEGKFLSESLTLLAEYNIDKESFHLKTSYKLQGETDVNLTYVSDGSERWSTFDDHHGHDGEVHGEDVTPYSGIVEIGVKTCKDLKLSEGLNVPLCGSLIYNPLNNATHIVLGLRV